MIELILAIVGAIALLPIVGIILLCTFKFKQVKAAIAYARSAYNSIQLLRANSSLFKPAPLEKMRGM